jgi:nucleotide-binding universal stress UspA family protein
MLTIRSILAPTDWSAPSIRALQIAGSLAEQNNAELIILHVVSLPAVMYGPPTESYLRHALEELRRVQPAEGKLHLEHLVVEGDPATEILRVAREHRCDLIVMGTHGRSGLTRLLMGSVAEEVVRKASCLVLAVKTAPSEASQETQPSGRHEPLRGTSRGKE